MEIGPSDIQRLVLFTGGSQTTFARFVAANLAHALPDVDIHVLFQAGTAAAAQPLNQTEQVPSAKRAYWAMRRTLADPVGAWGQCQLRQWQTEVSRRLREGTPPIDRLVNVQEVRKADDCVERIKVIEPDLLLIFGGPVLAAAVVETAPIAVNVHCGKLPEYRGVKSALFALANAAPQHVGVTLHVATPHLDAGPVIRWRPVPPQSAESLEALSVRLYESAIAMVEQLVGDLRAGPVRVQTQAGPSHLYRSRDFTAAVLRDARRNHRDLLKASTAPDGTPAPAVS